MKVSRVFFDWLPPVLWASVIFGLSHRSTLPPMDGPLINDKVAHALVYSILAWLLFRALARQTVPGFAAWLSFALSSVYGITDEVHQYFVPGRMASVYDWYADVLGAGLVSLAAWMLSLGLHRRPKADVPGRIR